MRPAAQLERHATHVDHAHPIAVLLAEQRHRAGGDGLLVGHLPRLDREILPDVCVDLGLDGAELIVRDRAVMTEVEAQALRSHHRPRLAHVRSQNAAEGRVDQVRRRVIALDVAAPRFVHLRGRGRRLEALAERPHHGALTVDLQHVFDGQLPAVALHDPRIAHLAARLGVERVLGQH